MSEPSVPPREDVRCYYCGSERRQPLLEAEDDLTGKPGRFPFVSCEDCGLVYQSPRISIEDIKAYYDDEYIAHRKSRAWGPLSRLIENALDRLDRKKIGVVRPYVQLDADSEVLDVGCGAGTFLTKVRTVFGSHGTGVDFIDLSHLPGVADFTFHNGLFYASPIEDARYDLVTMWHFLEHDYDPHRSLVQARRALAEGGRLVIEVPRLDSLSYRLYHDRWPGLQAPQHTVLYSRSTLLRQVARAGLSVIDYLPYGAYPAYFYLFAGLAFKLLKGRGLDLRKAAFPYFAGQLLLAPVLLFEKKMNLAMQTVICGRGGG